jgi:hypothetical protein
LHVCDKQIKCPTSTRRHFKRKNKNKGQAKQSVQQALESISKAKIEKKLHKRRQHPPPSVATLTKTLDLD